MFANEVRWKKLSWNRASHTCLFRNIPATSFPGFLPSSHTSNISLKIKILMQTFYSSEEDEAEQILAFFPLCYKPFFLLANSLRTEDNSLQLCWLGLSLIHMLMANGTGQQAWRKLACIGHFMPSLKGMHLYFPSFIKSHPEYNAHISSDKKIIHISLERIFDSSGKWEK